MALRQDQRVELRSGWEEVSVIFVMSQRAIFLNRFDLVHIFWKLEFCPLFSEYITDRKHYWRGFSFKRGLVSRFRQVGYQVTY